jgi:hypothetical protein
MGVKLREKDGAWWLFIDYRRRRKAKRVCGIGANRAESRRVADLVAKKVELRLAEGDLGVFEAPEPEKPVTLTAYAETWLSHYAESACKASTVRAYRANLKRQILPTTRCSSAPFERGCALASYSAYSGRM